MAGHTNSVKSQNNNCENGSSSANAKSNESTEKTQSPKIQKKKRNKKVKKGKHEVIIKKKAEIKASSPRTVSSKSTFAQIAKELKAKRIAQMAYAAAMAKKKKKNRVLRDEELYTDKDRAAAVNLGTKDIKHSLKLKKKEDKNFDSQIPEEGEPATLLALGNNELRGGDLKIALNFINKALDLNPEDKNGLVARSKCYLSLGHPRLALQDAETALLSDKTFVRAIYQKAEALYHLGDFEHSLMYYHRGHRLRPELESFRLGVQKAQEAIENTIRSTGGLRNRKAEKIFSSSSNNSILCNKSESKTSSNIGKRMTADHVRSKSAAPAPKSSSKRFFGELGTDKMYLENLLKHPDLICINHVATNMIKTHAEEGITFLKSRQEFWRQQKPSRNPTKKVEKLKTIKSSTN